MKQTEQWLKQRGIMFAESESLFDPTSEYIKEMGSAEDIQNPARQELLEEVINLRGGLVIEDTQLFFSKLGVSIMNSETIKRSPGRWIYLRYLPSRGGYKARGVLRIMVHSLNLLVHLKKESPDYLEQMVPGYQLKKVFQPEEAERMLMMALQEEAENIRHTIDKSVFKERLLSELCEKIKSDVMEKED